MIGPHQGHELELMLAGKKNLALFYDIIMDGQDIAEEIIPEQAFAPHVASGVLYRTCEIIHHAKSPHPAKYVLFTVKGHEWRAAAFLWMHKECREGRRPFDDAHEYFVGRLLGYEEGDIAYFIEHRRRKKIPA